MATIEFRTQTPRREELQLWFGDQGFRYRNRQTEHTATGLVQHLIRNCGSLQRRNEIELPAHFCSHSFDERVILEEDGGKIIVTTSKTDIRFSDRQNNTVQTVNLTRIEIDSKRNRILKVWNGSSEIHSDNIRNADTIYYVRQLRGREQLERLNEVSHILRRAIQVTKVS